ncbi:LysR substrate-binding domain-containing protein [Nocardia vermiculata]|uniref:LysR family transcriptional regulator n=1 Tax=Nocardia vermiculata TaxID=257274 RepID=A0A846Y6L4_9NOCA|nr:LysR substrate-binding domain-containing protein [Nocardia vermiculata]NKY53532.1 LysR family transcriptional regulator [Nocardia vermiculata]
MTESAPALRIGYVPGVTVAKWARVWAERFPDAPLELVAVPQARQRDALVRGEVDMCFVRLPLDRAELHAIPLYSEVAVAVVPKDHPIALFDEVSLADLDGERMQDASDIDALDATVELVAAVGGAAVVPHALARLHHRRDLIFRPVTDVEPTQVSLAWPIDDPGEYVEEFIGVVRGRSARSSRTAGERDRRGRGEASGRSGSAAGTDRRAPGSSAGTGRRGGAVQRGDAARRAGAAGRGRPGKSGPRKRRGR